MIRLFTLFCLSLVGSLGLIAQTHCTLKSKELCQSHLDELADSDLSTKPIGEVALAVGQRFMGTPYIGKTLEIGDQEQLVVDMEGMDCTTFLENVVVFSRLVKMGRLTFMDFQHELRRLRYRDGVLSGYPSRLHYFSDWISNNEAKGIVRDVTGRVGGIPYEKSIDFMSTHRDAYAQLSDDQYFATIQTLERELNQRQRFYIPKQRVASAEGAIRDGDLIAITTKLEGLDIIHVGVAMHQNGRLHLLHASTDQKKVVISAKPLAEYLMGNRLQTGIMVARMVEP